LTLNRQTLAPDDFSKLEFRTLKNPLESLRFRTRGVLRRVKKATQSIGNWRKRNAPADKYVRTLKNVEACCGSLNGKRVLEIGCDPNGEFLAYLSSQRTLSEAVGVNPCLNEHSVRLKYSLLKEDARSLPFPDNSFDVIVSISVFEHVQNLDVALAEMYRVLRPGGYLFAEFGPIWSSVWGHHLWFYHGDDVRDWRNTQLPPYAHLLMSEAELRAWCQDRYRDESLITKICDFVYRSDDQNRLFYSDYVRLFDKSSFSTLFCVGHPDLPFSNGYAPGDSKQLFKDLATRYPDKSGFGYHVVSALLAK